MSNGMAGVSVLALFFVIITRKDCLFFFSAQLEAGIFRSPIDKKLLLRGLRIRKGVLCVKKIYHDKKSS
jgi:hypothetical protein